MRGRNEWGHVWWSVGVAVVLGGLALALPRTGGAPPVAEAAEEPHTTSHIDKATARMLDEIADYRNWGRFTADVEKGGPDAPGHGSASTLRYFNGTARAGLRAGAWKFPVGSALVSEDKSALDGSPTELTAMIKQPDGQWYWIAYTPEGRVLKEKGRPVAGQVGRCIVCHSQSTRDMVLNPVIVDRPSGAPHG
jgi:hypothetical protein